MSPEPDGASGLRPVGALNELLSSSDVMEHWSHYVTHVGRMNRPLKIVGVAAMYR